MRTPKEILADFSKVAEEARDAEFYVRCVQRKAYLTNDVIQRWHIGKAPSLGQCKAAGLTEEDLEAVGLYVERDFGKCMFFRDCMVIPFYESGQVVYLTSRRLVDYDPKSGEPLSKAAKSLSMRAPDSRGRGGIAFGTGFNIDELKKSGSIMLVEGPLDAIACQERGHPAVAMIGKAPRPGLVKAIKESEIQVFLALDGTADVSELQRLNVASMIGPATWICVLPEASDPDDMNADELRTLKASARECDQEWVRLLKTSDGLKNGSSKTFRMYLRNWLIVYPQRVQGLRTELGLTSDEWRELVRDETDPLPGSALDSAGGHPNAAFTGLSEQDREVLELDRLKGELASISLLEGLPRDAATTHLLKGLAGPLGSAGAATRARIRNVVCEQLKLPRGAFDSALREAESGIGATKSAEVNWLALAQEFIHDLRSKGLASAS